MATGPSTLVSDVITPSVFTPYTQQLTEEKSRLVEGGILERSQTADALLAGGGKTFDMPSWKDLDNEAENVSSDDPADIMAISASGGSPALPAAFYDAIPKKTGTADEIAVRLSRNQGWSSGDLTEALAGSDPMDSIANRVAKYWARRLQAAFIATWNGVCKDNGANDSGDYANDIVGGSFVDGVTNFSAEAALDALVTMGDSQDQLGAMLVHSVVYNRMQKNNLIDFIPDARGETMIETFLRHRVIVDDGMPSGTGVVRASGSAGTTGMYETWFFGPGATKLGVGMPKVPTEVERHARAGNGGGQETLWNRVEWCIHPVGHAYIGTAPKGGPSNAATTNNLNIATSWNRVFPERKQIKFCRLITREA